VVRALLTAGADARAATSAGTLASHLAAARGDAASLSALLAAGAPPGAADADKQTILHLAARSGCEKTGINPKP
jgi:ankyrin repeat protein